jgi:ABC-2 type transport system ATP-binding protein
MIQVTHLVRRFGAFTAVDDISFALERGDVVGFLGPNGAGKTTTMRMLTGFLPATSGSIEVAGFDVLTQSLQVRRHIGYLPESVPLYREHRVEEMLAFQGRLHELSRADARRRAAEVLERVGLAERSRSLIGKLSKGQRQRIGIAVALLPDPDVLILDEPTSGLDPLQRIEVRELIGELAQDRTVLLSSHILPEIEAVCPRVIVLDRGRIVADGTKDVLVDELGGAGRVVLEAAVPDAAEAARLLATLPGVRDVHSVEAPGIHRRFELEGEGDLREDVGALAAQRGWALRELSWTRPTLEQLFARLALGIVAEGDVSSAAAVEDVAPRAPALDLPMAGGDAPAAATLNPFVVPGSAADGDACEEADR